MIVPLRELLVENFRGVRKATLTLDPQVTVLFGSNAAGKTSLLDALAIVLGAIVARVPQAKGRSFAKHKDDIRIPWHLSDEEAPWTQRPYVRIEARAVGGVVWDKLQLRAPSDNRHVAERSGQRQLNACLDPIVQSLLDDPAADDVFPLVASYGNERAVVAVPLRERGFNTEFRRFGALDASLSATTHFKSVFEWFRVMEDEERRQREKRRDWEYLLPELEWVRKAVAAADLRCSNPRVETKPLRMLVDFKHEDGRIQSLDLRALSDGYRTHFALVVDVARRMVQLNPSEDLSDPERGTNSPAIILIDEVDLHLDPRWQGRVVSGLRSAFPRAQFVLSTHSEQVLGSVHAQQVRHLRWSHGAIEVEGVPFAQGATGERILIELMGAPERVEGVITRRLRKYLELIDQGDGEGSAAVALRRQLEDELGQEPALHQAGLELTKRRLLAQLKGR